MTDDIDPTVNDGQGNRQGDREGQPDHGRPVASTSFSPLRSNVMSR